MILSFSDRDQAITISDFQGIKGMWFNESVMQNSEFFIVTKIGIRISHIVDYDFDKDFRLK